MKITRTRFYLLTLLILLIPIYGNWKLFLFGNLTTGKVVRIKEEVTILHMTSTYPILEFQTPDGVYQMKGPENVDYPIGSEYKILYYRNNPNRNMIFNLQGIAFNTKTIIAGLLLIFWIAFYLSFFNSTPGKQNLKDGKQAPKRRFPPSRNLGPN